MAEEKYQGWTNHETWAVDLYLTNDQGFYNEMMDMAKKAVKEKQTTYHLANEIKEYVENLHDYLEEDSSNHALRMMFDDIGSMWRVNWTEIAEAWIRDIKEDMDYKTKIPRRK